MPVEDGLLRHQDKEKECAILLKSLRKLLSVL